MIWVFFLAVPIYGEQTEHFKVLQLVGFFFLVLGTLVYNEILVIPFLGFNTNTREAIAKRDAAKKGLLDTSGGDAEYLASSPQAGYDHNR